MTALAIITAAVIIFALGFMAGAYANAPVGYETEDGFKFGEPDQ